MSTGLVNVAELEIFRVAVAMFVAVLILVMVLAPELATHTRVPSALTVMPVGFRPTLTVATTVLVAVSMTETVPAPLLVT